MKIEAEIQNLKNILVADERFYQIPDFQRPYSWDKDNVSDLVDDLLTAYMGNKDETYFCGSLVLVKNEKDNRFDIIDGQQRITTFIIISCVLRDHYSSELKEKAIDFISQSIQDKYEDSKRKLRFLTEDKFQISFEETILKGIEFTDAKNIEKIFHGNIYMQNAHFIKNLVEEKVLENSTKISINDFVVWLFQNVVLTVITCPSQDHAIQIFNVLNDRGLPLTPIDILKSSLMQDLRNDEDRNAFKVTWGEINSRLKHAGFNLDDMLNTYLYYIIATNPDHRLDKELLKVFKKENKKPIQIIREIQEFSDAYVETLTEENKYLYCLRYLKHRIYWHSILTTALHTNYAYGDELKSILVAFYYQNWIAGATRARIKQTSFNVLKLVKDGGSIEEIRQVMSENLNKYSTTNTFKEELDGDNAYHRSWGKAVLLLIEYFSLDDSKQSYIHMDNKLHLEHVLPQEPSGEWKKIFTTEEIEEWTNSLANLTLLSMKKNIQASNNSFKDKVNAYKNKDNVVSSFLMTQKIIESRKWNVAKLKTRKRDLINKVKEKLNLFE